MKTNSFRELRKLVPVAKAKPNNSMVMVAGKYFCHSSVQATQWMGLNKSEFETKLWETIRARYHETLLFNQQKHQDGTVKG